MEKSGAKDVGESPRSGWTVSPIKWLVGICTFLLLILHSALRITPTLHGLVDTSKHYSGESLSWEPCGDINKHLLECSTLDVPLDHFDAVNSGNRTWSIALMRLRGYEGKQNILLNPGGPGGSGLSFMYRIGEDLNKIVGESFHLLAFDPRGVNQSFPSGSCYPSPESRAAAILSAPKDPYTQSGHFAARAENLAQSCYDNLGDYGAYLNTPQTASDMNSILDAVGQKSMYYWGFSYGTTLGQTYAQMYPERSERVIIDGVSDQTGWYSSDKDIMYTRDVSDTQSTFDGFAKECIIAGPERCALADSFDSAQQLAQNITNLMLSLKTQPLSAYVNASSWGELGWTDLMHGAIFMALYKPKAWPPLASALSGILHGNNTDAFLQYGSKPDRSSFGNEMGTIVMMNDAAVASGTIQQRRSTQDLVAAIAKYEQVSIIAGGSFADDVFIQQEWRYPLTHNFVPADKIETAHPLLILSTTFDPICPLESARSAEKRYVGSVLVEQKGYGHCSISMPSLCKAKIVKKYLLDGTMPDKDTVCDNDGTYFELPDETQRVATSSPDLELLQALQHMALEFNNDV